MSALVIATVIAACSGDAKQDPLQPTQGKGAGSAAAFVEITPQEARVALAGQTVVLTLGIRDSRGRQINGRLVSWSSLDPAIAQVDASGHVTTMAQGTARIQAKVDAAADTARIVVEADAGVVSVRITPDQASIAVGASVGLVAAAYGADGGQLENRAITWQSLDGAVASVSRGGTVLGLAQGTAHIVASHFSHVDTATVEVSAAGRLPASIEIVPASAEIAAVGGTAPLGVYVRDGNGGIIGSAGTVWASMDPSIVTIHVGIARAVAEGVGRVTATLGALVDTAVVRVGGGVSGATVRITPENDTIPAIGGTVQLQAEVFGSNGTPIQNANVVWASLDPSVVVVTGPGRVAGAAKGVGRVVARYGAIDDTASIWVSPAPPIAMAAAVRVQPDADTIPSVGGSVQLIATVLDDKGQPMSGKEVQWASLSASVATVSASGLVTGVLAGVASIAASHNGLADTASVVVVASSDGGSQPNYTMKLHVDPDTLAVVGDQLVFEGAVFDEAGNPLYSAGATWTSLDPTIVALSGSERSRTMRGTALSAGVARITASYANASVTVRVHVSEPSSGAQPSAVRITPKNDTIPASASTVTLTGQVLDASGRIFPGVNVTWSSLDPSIATANGGVVTRVASGTARIQATYGALADTALIWVAPLTSGFVTWAVTYSPSYPTTSSNVTISATASVPAAILNTTISVDGSVVKTCAGGSCIYASAMAAGLHTYSVDAKDTAGKALNAGSGSFTVWQSRSGGITPGSKSSPHWPHMRTSVVDFRIHHVSAAQRDSEWDFAASHYDMVVGGTLNEYKSRNPTIQQIVYDLLYADETNQAGPMEAWLTANGYPVEDAYLHKVGTSKTLANRITFFQWTHDYYAFNLNDPGFQAWRKVRTQQLVALNTLGYRFDSIAWDVVDSGSIEKAIPAVTLEYGSRSAYYSDFRAALTATRQLVPAGYSMMNIATYYSKAIDRLHASTAGAASLEFANSPYFEQKWSAVDALINDGTTLMFGSGIPNSRTEVGYDDMNPGNYNTVAERVLMWLYASYLMVVDPARMEQVYFQSYRDGWSTRPFDTTWLIAFERDIGLARNPRTVVKSGTDGAGQTYQVYMREFDNALVLIRPKGNWSQSQYADQTAVTVTLPPGSWHMLLADGALTGAITSVQLRNSEAIILIK